MFREIAYYLIFGKPLIVYLGILTFISISATAIIGHMNLRGKTSIPLQWHFRLAKISIALAIVHGFLGIMSYL